MWIEEPGAYIGMPFHKRHITHFAESINLLLLKLMAPTEFPTVSVLSFFYVDYESLSSYVPRVR